MLLNVAINIHIGFMSCCILLLFFPLELYLGGSSPFEGGSRGVPGRGTMCRWEVMCRCWHIHLYSIYIYIYVSIYIYIYICINIYIYIY